MERKFRPTPINMAFLIFGIIGLIASYNEAEIIGMWICSGAIVIGLTLMFTKRRTIRICAKCDTRNNFNAEFCKKCGVKFRPKK
jgi:ribosomal protein L40E